MTEVYQSASLIPGSIDLHQPMYSAWTTVAPCSSSHKMVLGKLLPPLLCLWLHRYLSWKSRVTMFAHTWRCTKSVLHNARYVRQGYIPVHTEAGKLGTETVLRISGSLAPSWEKQLERTTNNSLYVCRMKCRTQREKKDTDCQLCEGTCVSEPVLENLTCGMFLLMMLNVRGTSTAMW